MSNSRHKTNKTQSALILRHGLTQKINDKTIYAENMYSPNFTVDNKTFCLSLHFNGDNSYLFVNDKEVNKCKAKNCELIKHSMCSGGLSLDYYNKDKLKYTGETFMTLVLVIAPLQMIKYLTSITIMAWHKTRMA